MPDFRGVRDPSHQPYYEALMSKFKLTYEPDIETPETWEEVKALDRPAKIRAARVFLRKAAVKLCEEAGFLPEDVVMLFEGVPEWISARRHAWKREKHEAPKAMRCTSCTFIATVKEFWESGKLSCPHCGAADAVQIPGDDPLAVAAAVRKVRGVGEHTLSMDQVSEIVLKVYGARPGDHLYDAGRVDVPEFEAAAQSQEESGDRKAAFCACDGQPCPVCEGLGRKGIIIQNHSCIVCETLYCPNCHGIVTAGSSRAFDSCARCKC